MGDAVVGLAEAIEALRAELTAAVAEGQDSAMQFTLEPVELTVQAVVEKNANGKIGWKILEAGGSYKSATTQTLKLTLTPMWRREDGTLVRDFTISAVQSAGERDHVGPKP
ncbi:trypco2 family protein [Kutzneria chonburiensis]|uniref:Trypco2 family protein n=1 Tax=Kutzneria chonburiensis TaxID=1483604 RepID=A0ABV6MQP9_9PSEU|nr:trypco2 family protein [Kutzneria chonburiensis]